MNKTITIFGTSKANPGDEIFETAKALGNALAEQGFAIANGGYNGTMLASAKGATAAGGKTIGVTCTAFGRKGPNKYIEKNLSTDSLPQRLQKLIELGDAYIVLPGGTGTLLELAEVWELKNKHFINPTKPIILLGDFWKPLLDTVASADEKSLDCVTIANSPGQAVEIIKNALT